MMRTSTFWGWVQPSGSTMRSCRTRRSLAWRLTGISATSSRKMVPPWASWNRPGLFLAAPVKAPAMYPNISDSSRVSGMATQFTATKGLSLRRLTSWMARAKSSLPVPDSPSRSTEASLAARGCRMSSTRVMTWLWPTMSPRVCRSLSVRRRIWLSVRSRKVSTAPLTRPFSSRRREALMLTAARGPVAAHDQDGLVHDLPALAQAFAQDAGALAAVGPEHLPAFAAHGLPGRDAGDARGGFVEEGDVGIEVDGEDAVGDALQDGLAGDPWGAGEGESSAGLPRGGRGRRPPSRVQSVTCARGIRRRPPVPSWTFRGSPGTVCGRPA